MFKNNLQKNKKQDKKFKEKGFTLLFAVLVSTLVLAIGASIISIALKQVILSGSARDSQFAFYAANTGVECALYWYYNGYDDGSRVFRKYDGDTLRTDIENINCADYEIMDDLDGDSDCDGRINQDEDWCTQQIESDDHFISKFRVKFTDVEYCADVIVETEVAQADDPLNGITTGQEVTTIESRGYNTCDETNPRRIERTLNIEA
jgi:hypothetical protein